MAFSSDLWAAISGQHEANNHPSYLLGDDQPFYVAPPKKKKKVIQPAPSPKPIPLTNPNQQPKHTMTLWEAISGQPARSDEKQWEQTQNDFMRIFGGITPGSGKVNVASTAHPNEAANLYKKQGYNVTPDYLKDNTHVAPKPLAVKPSLSSNQTPTSNPHPDNPPTPQTTKPDASNLDTLISKALNLDLNYFPVGDKWMLNKAKQKIGTLSEDQKSFLNDPNVSDAQKVIMLGDWVKPGTINEIHQWAAERKKDLDAAGGGTKLFGGPKGYGDYLKEHEKKDVSNLYLNNWQSSWDESLKKHNLAPNKENYHNPSFGPPVDEPWAMENILANAENYKGAGGGSAWAWQKAQNYKNQGGYEGWIQRWNKAHPDNFSLSDFLSTTNNAQQSLHDRQPIPGGNEAFGRQPDSGGHEVFDQQPILGGNESFDLPPIPGYYGNDFGNNYSGGSGSTLPPGVSIPPGHGGSAAGYGLGGILSNLKNALNFVGENVYNTAQREKLKRQLEAQWENANKRIFQRNINALANAGILDSSVASSILADTSGARMNAYMNLEKYLADLAEGARRSDLSTALSAGNLSLSAASLVPNYLTQMYQLENYYPWLAGIAQENYYDKYANNEMPSGWSL